MIRHQLEFEPDARPVHVVSFPLLGGHVSQELYAQSLHFEHPSMLPKDYQLAALAARWRNSVPTTKPFDDDVHPSADFAMYMLQIALDAAISMNEALKKEGPLSVDVPLILILADGWNHEGCTDKAWACYQQMRRQVDAVKTVKEFKDAYPAWEEGFYQHFGRTGKCAAWDAVQALIRPMKDT